MAPGGGPIAAEQHNGHGAELSQPQKSVGGGHENVQPPTKEPLLARVKQIWAKTGITWRVYRMMFKGALAPLIAIAAYQATAWADHYTTIGYLVGIMSVLSLPISPRAKFLQSMLMQLFLTCLACAISSLALYCAVRARINSVGFEGPGTGGAGTSGLAANGAETAGYNSSASAVAGVWLFVMIYGISVLRAKLPQYNVSCIMFAVFANVAMTYAPQFSTMTQASAFALKLLEAYLTAFAIATGVSLLVFPLTSREVVFGDVNSFISSLQAALQANLTYLDSLETTDMFAAQRTNTVGVKPARSPEATALMARIKALTAAQAKLATDLPFAKREVALGKLGPDDLQQVSKLLRATVVPTLGLSSMSDIFDRTSEDRGWDRSVSFAHATLADAQNEAEKIRIETIHEWHELIKLLREPFTGITDIINEGLQHVALTLQLVKQSTGTKDDQEAAGDTPLPGSKNFAAYFDRRAEEFQESKKVMLRGWCRIHDIELSEDFFSNPTSRDFEAPGWMNAGNFTEGRKRLRRQLMIMLYVEFLLYSISRRTYDLVLFADRLRESGKLGKTRLVVPGLKTVRKALYNTLSLKPDAGPHDYEDSVDHMAAAHFGDAFQKKRDPEHLPPENAWERLTEQLRKVPHFLNSPASKFGFRVALATLAIGIVSYLEATQVFFTTNRLFWAQIMTSIGMSPSAGQSLRTLVLRITGTFVAMVLSLIAYYIVDEKIPGILVFYFLFLHGGVWFMLRYPTRAPVGIILQVTLTLILGYELQVRKIGIATAISNGQAYYPVYELGPIRLATVVGGLFVGWVFTVFPYPITEHSQLRQSLGSALYLLANYYSVVHETVQLRLAGAEGDTNAKDSPGRKLEKVRYKIFSKCHVVLSGLRAQAGFIKFDIPIGGKFPIQQYTEIANQLQSILNFMSLVSIASASFSELRNNSTAEHESEWLQNFRKVIGEANLTTQSVTTLLALLSASIRNGNALPPYVRVPEPYQLSERLDNTDSDILSVRHIAEPGYASFAVIQIGTKCLVDDLKELLAEVKTLVGELDFSYQIPFSENLSEETLTYSRTWTGSRIRNKQE